MIQIIAVVRNIIRLQIPVEKVLLKIMKNCLTGLSELPETSLIPGGIYQLNAALKWTLDSMIY